MREVHLLGVGTDVSESTSVILLQESTAGGGRILPIPIEQGQAAAIGQELCNGHSDQSATRELLVNVIAQCGRTVLRVLISHIVDDEFLAALILDEETGVPAHVIDAVMIAHHVEVPILVGSETFDQVARPESQMVTPAGWRIDVSAY